MLSPEFGGGHEAARVHHASRRRGTKGAEKNIHKPFAKIRNVAASIYLF